MTSVLALACAMPLALSHDLGGALGLVALTPLMFCARHVERPLAFGFLCGFAEVFCTMFGAADYSVLIPLILALQGGVARAALAWAVAQNRGPWLPVSLLVVGQGLRTSSVLTLPLSTGHDLAAMPLLAWPAALGGGALLTALCGLVAYALSHQGRHAAHALKAVLVLVLLAGVHEWFRPPAGADVELKASILQGGVPNWVYRQSSIDPKARALVSERYLEGALAEAHDRLIILPESAVRQPWGDNPMSQTYRRLHARGNALIAGVNWYYDGALRNSAMIWPRDESKPRFQSKRVVVPIVERVFEQLDAAPQPLPFGGTVLLCIESVYPRFVPPEARWVLVISNDAGVGRSTPRRAFERESRLRAIESGMSLVRAGQDGMTYTLGSDGAILSHLPVYGQGVLRVERLPGPRPTLRGWAGDWFWGLSWLVLAVELMRRRIGRGRAV